MNINNVYYAEIYRLTNIERKKGTVDLIFKSNLTRNTIVYNKNNGEFYDLLANKTLAGSYKLGDLKGSEKVDLESLIPFDNLIKQSRKNLCKREVIKMYKEYMNINKEVIKNDILFEDLKDIKITKKIKEDVLKHPEKYSNCDVRIQKGMFYTDEEKENYIEESLNKSLPSGSKKLLRTKRK